MKKLVKFCCVLLVLGVVLFTAGRLAGGEPYTSYWHGELHTLRESLSMGNAFIPPWRAPRSWSNHPQLNQTDGLTDVGGGLPFAPAVTELDFEFGGGDYVIACSDEDAYTIAGDNTSHIQSWFDDDGTWHVEGNPRGTLHALVTIYLPTDVYFDSINIETGANAIEIEQLCAREIDLEIGAAAVAAGELTCSELSVSVGAGSLDMSWVDAGDIDIEVGMGAVYGILAGEAADYRYEAEAALGEITLGGTAIAGGIASKRAGGQGRRLLDLTTGMGSIVLELEA